MDDLWSQEITRSTPARSDSASRAAQTHPLSAGTHLGPYMIEGLIAEGGSARVYRALDQTLARPVALKVLGSGTGGESRERFLREVQLVAGLVHPHIVSLYAAGEQDGYAFAAMELLPGSLADELARDQRVPWSRALRAARDACLGLDFAWKKGIVHRDVKPSNLLRDPSGAVKVGDFGLAKDLSSELELTLQGVVLGTPLYVSPEQGCGRATDQRSDLYSLGAALFHLVGGRPPYHAATPFDLIVRHAVEPTPSLGDDVPMPVSAFVHRLMEKNPGARPQTYEEAIALIDRALETEGDSTPRVVVAPAAAKHTGGDALAISQLAAARAARNLGRAARARDMLDRLYRDRGAVWTEAGLELAALHEASGDLAASRTILEALSQQASDADTRALALWTLGTLAEKESEAALQRAADAYARVLEVSGTMFPKTLLEGRISRLRARAAGQKK